MASRSPSQLITAAPPSGGECVAVKKPKKDHSLGCCLPRITHTHTHTHTYTHTHTHVSPYRSLDLLPSVTVMCQTCLNLLYLGHVNISLAHSSPFIPDAPTTFLNPRKGTWRPPPPPPPPPRLLAAHSPLRPRVLTSKSGMRGLFGADK